MQASIVGVTITTPDVKSAADCYCHCLGYQLISDGQISTRQAENWNAAATAGRAMSMLAPPSNDGALLRLVESPRHPNYVPLKSVGWNALELHVADVYELADRLASSPLKHLGGPRDLLNDGNVVALQMLGIADEVLYLTQISGDLRETYGFTTDPVGPVFIMVLGTANLERSLAFYQTLGASTRTSGSMLIKVLANAHQLDPETTHFDMGSAVWGQVRLEIDQYPTSATPRPRADGELPSGIAMLSIAVPSLDAIDQQLRGAIAPGCADSPYHGARSALVVGPDQEWLELIETETSRGPTS